MLYVVQVPECGLMLRPLILCTGTEEIAGQVKQFFFLHGCVPTMPVFRASCFTLTSLFLILDPVRLTKLNILGWGALSSVVLGWRRLGEEARLGSNFSTTFNRFESLP